jgi:hypothetical protein
MGRIRDKEAGFEAGVEEGIRNAVPALGVSGAGLHASFMHPPRNLH